MDFQDWKELATRIVVPRRGLSQVFSVARFLFLLVGMATASIYCATEHNEWAAIGIAVLSYIIFRYGQIKGWLQ